MKQSNTSHHLPGENGQTTALMMVFLSTFLLGFFGLVTDYSQVWAHRQMAQSAADAACQAGAADLYLNYQNAAGASSSYGLNFGWIGTAFNCGGSSANTAVCKYAEANGYSGSNVSVSFPSSVSGAPSLSGFGTIAFPYIKVTVADTVNLTFSRFVQSATTFPVHASASCGMSPASVPIPMVVLNKTASGTLSLSGNPTISIFGGPSQAIQVDSSSSTAFTAGGSSLVDLHQAGPSTTGANVGVFGNEPRLGASNLNLGTGKWIAPSFPYGDPWVLTPAPAAPATAGAVTSVGLGLNGCPDPSGCMEFAAGNYVGCSTKGSINGGGNGCLIIPAKYSITFAAWKKNTVFTQGNEISAGGFVFEATSATGTTGGTAPAWPVTLGATVTDGSVAWKNVGNPTSSPNTAIFDPGVYYLDSQGMQLNSNSTVRPSTATGDGTHGTTFYFSQGGSDISVAANSGKSGGVSNYTIAGDTFSTPLKCPNGASNPTQLPATVSGNILLGPCTGTYAATSTDGFQYRGFLFFQSRASSGTPSWGGGGQFLLAGFMYFHDTSYSSTLSLSGNSASGAYTLGNIVADKISLGGTSGINMILNPASSYQILRPTLLQ